MIDRSIKEGLNLLMRPDESMPEPVKALAEVDLSLSFEATPAWNDFRDKRIFITGATGFFGHWLLESLIYANLRLNLNVHISVLSRDPRRWRALAPHLSTCPEIQMVEGDVRSFKYPTENFDWILHGAGPVRRDQLAVSSTEVLSQIVDGTRHVLEFGERANTSRFLMISSGAVYGHQPAGLETIPESYSVPEYPSDKHDPDPYCLGKRAAEALCAKAIYYRNNPPVVARCFSFVGPFLPLNDRFAIGNFISDAKQGRPIKVLGSGKDMRSYLYAGEMAAWLWTLLARGTPGQAYNVGSADAVTMSQVAALVAGIADSGTKVEVLGESRSKVSRYVPDIRRIREQLGLYPAVSLADGIRRTLEWLS